MDASRVNSYQNLIVLNLRLVDFLAFQYLYG